MSTFTRAARTLLGDQTFEDTKARALGSGASAVLAALPEDKGGNPPRAIIEHKLTTDEWQKIALGVAILLTGYYFLVGRR